MDDIIAARVLIKLLDLTSLDIKDTDDKIEKLCQKAKSPYGNVAAVCVFPRFIKTAKSSLKGSGIKIASVVNFPKGENDIEKTREEIKDAIKLGADEIDVVFPYKKFLAGDISFCENFTEMVVKECEKRYTSKMILETGEFEKLIDIKKATQLCINKGIKFIKTSTGKSKVSATPEVANLILETIAENKNIEVGFKASGGIRETYDAKKYLILAQAILGSKWVSAKTLRIGASSLIDDLIKTIKEGE